jgi:O-antigen/teichoic acid export membrane protein
MSSQVAVIEGRVSAGGRTRRNAIVGAWLLSGSMVISGLLTYGFHVIAARSLGAEAYGQVAVLWAAMFIGAVVLFRPLEQTTSRAIADRLARGEEVRTVVRSVAMIGGATVGVVLAAGALGWSTVTDRLFLGSDFMTLMLLLGIAGYGVVYVVRGLTGGMRWFEGYGLALIADSLARLALVVPLLVVASQNVAAAGVALAGAAAVVVPLHLSRGRLRPIFERGEGSRFHVGAALAFAAPASLIAAADQLLVNGGAVLVMLGGGTDASKTAGVVFAATMLVRVPVYLFQGLAASLLPNLTRLQATEDPARFHRAVIQVAGFLLTAGALIVAFAAFTGPQAMQVMYGSDFVADRGALVLLGAGVGCYLAAATISQALLALDEAIPAGIAWAASACLFVVLYVLAPGGELARVSSAFAVAALGSLVALSLLLATKVRRR